MFSKNYMDKEVNKPEKYKIDHANICDSVIIFKKTLKKKNISKHLPIWPVDCFFICSTQLNI